MGGDFNFIINFIRNIQGMIPIFYGNRGWGVVNYGIGKEFQFSFYGIGIFNRRMFKAKNIFPCFSKSVQCYIHCHRVVLNDL